MYDFFLFDGGASIQKYFLWNLGVFFIKNGNALK